MAYEEDELTTFTKVRGLLIDECQDTFVQYADFLAHHLTGALLLDILNPPCNPLATIL